MRKVHLDQSHERVNEIYCFLSCFIKGYRLRAADWWNHTNHVAIWRDLTSKWDHYEDTQPCTVTLNCSREKRSLCSHMQSVADPGFPRRGALYYLQGGGVNLLFGQIFPGNCMKMKEIGP